MQSLYRISFVMLKRAFFVCLSPTRHRSTTPSLVVAVSLLAYMNWFESRCQSYVVTGLQDSMRKRGQQWQDFRFEMASVKKGSYAGSKRFKMNATRLSNENEERTILFQKQKTPRMKQPLVSFVFICFSLSISIFCIYCLFVETLCNSSLSFHFHSSVTFHYCFEHEG